MFSRFLGGLHLLVWSRDRFGQLTRLGCAFARVGICSESRRFCLRSLVHVCRWDWEKTLFSFAYEMGWL